MKLPLITNCKFKKLNLLIQKCVNIEKQKIKTMKSYLISFGNSKNYRLDIQDDNSSTICDLKKSVADYISANFPAVADKNFYESMIVKQIPENQSRDYDGYPVFSAESLHEIEGVLSCEIHDMEDVAILNRNAPYDDK